MELTTEPGRAGRNYRSRLWRCRELFHLAAWRGNEVRCRQTAKGMARSLIGPFLTMLVFPFRFVFNRAAKLHAAPFIRCSLMVAAATRGSKS